MSVKNKRLDRDDAGRIKRRYTGPDSTFWLGHTPKWWTKLFMTRPKRRENKRVCRRILCGENPDGMAFPLGNRKPHDYYW